MKSKTIFTSNISLAGLIIAVVCLAISIGFRNLGEYGNLYLQSQPYALNQVLASIGISIIVFFFLWGSVGRKASIIGLYICSLILLVIGILIHHEKTEEEAFFTNLHNGGKVILVNSETHSGEVVYKLAIELNQPANISFSGVNASIPGKLGPSIEIPSTRLTELAESYRKLHPEGRVMLLSENLQSNLIE